MRRAEDSIQVRAKKMLLLAVLEDYMARIKLRRDFHVLEKKIEAYEEKCGIKRIKMVNNNMTANPSLNGIVQTSSA